MATIDVDGDEAADGLVALVVAVVELLVDALEREAIRRMESGELSDEEVERLGRRLAAIEEEVESLKREQGVDRSVDELRAQLDGLVDDAVHSLREDGHAATGVADRGR